MPVCVIKHLHKQSGGGPLVFGEVWLDKCQDWQAHSTDAVVMVGYMLAAAKQLGTNCYTLKKSLSTLQERHESLRHSVTITGIFG